MEHIINTALAKVKEEPEFEETEQKREYDVEKDYSIINEQGTKKRRYQCHKCNYKSNKRCHMTYHVMTHTGIHPFQCDQCQQTFTAKASLQRHEKIHTGLKNFACTVCPSRFVDAYGLRSHMVVHTKEKTHECEACGKRFTLSCNLIRHRRIHTGEKRYACKKCDAKFTDYSSLRYHDLKHTGEVPYLCHICDKQFKTASDMKRHSSVHSGERPYECQTCKRPFKQKEQLRAHMRTHDNNRKTWECRTCGKACFSKSSWQQHENTHKGIKKYACPICNKHFTSKMYLKNHKVVHTGETPYKCEICGQEYNQRANLQRHKRSHSTEMKYKCNYCDRRFKYWESITYHKRSVHLGLLPYYCETCGFCFKSEGGVKRHKCRGFKLEDVTTPLGNCLNLETSGGGVVVKQEIEESNDTFSCEMMDEKSFQRRAKKFMLTQEKGAKKTKASDFVLNKPSSVEMRKSKFEENCVPILTASNLSAIANKNCVKQEVEDIFMNYKIEKPKISSQGLRFVFRKLETTEQDNLSQKNLKNSMLHKKENLSSKTKTNKNKVKLNSCEVDKDVLAETAGKKLKKCATWKVKLKTRKCVSKLNTKKEVNKGNKVKNGNMLDAVRTSSPKEKTASSSKDGINAENAKRKETSSIKKKRKIQTKTPTVQGKRQNIKAKVYKKQKQTSAKIKSKSAKSKNGNQAKVNKDDNGIIIPFESVEYDSFDTQTKCNTAKEGKIQAGDLLNDNLDINETLFAVDNCQIANEGVCIKLEPMMNTLAELDSFENTVPEYGNSTIKQEIVMPNEIMCTASNTCASSLCTDATVTQFNVLQGLNCLDVGDQIIGRKTKRKGGKFTLATDRKKKKKCNATVGVNFRTPPSYTVNNDSLSAFDSNNSEDKKKCKFAFINQNMLQPNDEASTLIAWKAGMTEVKSEPEELPENFGTNQVLLVKQEPVVNSHNTFPEERAENEKDVDLSLKISEVYCGDIKFS